MLRLFDFECEDGHIFEIMVDSETRTTTCPKCGTSAHRLLSSPRFKLESCSGDFPGAYYKWENDRKKDLERIEKRS
jgi:putative FmdB family regulatory protein